MSEEILINITPMESRVAVVENGVLQEVHVERTQRRGIVGNIYKGKVVRVLPGMQAAFIDIGLDRAAFIHASEISMREGPAVESIASLVHDGQSLVVQVTKDPIGSKGARLTTQLSIPSRYLVYMPRTAHVGISLKIEDEAERERLKKLSAIVSPRKASKRPVASFCAPLRKAPVPTKSSWTFVICAGSGTRSAIRSRPSAHPP